MNKNQQSHGYSGRDNNALLHTGAMVENALGSVFGTEVAADIANSHRAPKGATGQDQTWAAGSTHQIGQTLITTPGPMHAPTPMDTKEITQRAGCSNPGVSSTLSTAPSGYLAQEANHLALSVGVRQFPRAPVGRAILYADQWAGLDLSPMEKLMYAWGAAQNLNPERMEELAHQGQSLSGAIIATLRGPDRQQ